uniref:Uncharacterized protein n=1 Tax=Megaselia scalaris TaxID=36166 RepID=T1GH37_MEGSC
MRCEYGVFQVVLLIFLVIFGILGDVLWLVIGPIKNAGIGFALLQEAGKSLNFISNNAMRTDEEYIQKLTSLANIST